MIRHIFSYALFGAFGLVTLSIFFPTTCGSHENARRSGCQSNLKQIGLAFLQYAQDNDDHLPPIQWANAITPQTKTDDVFQCPSTMKTPGTSDYFFNARLLRKETQSIKQPVLLALAGESSDDGPLYSTLSKFPSAWHKDENSPAGRHLGTGNYLFVDGHVKSRKYNAVPTNFLFP